MSTPQRTRLTNDQKLTLIEESQQPGFKVEDATAKYSLSKAAVYRIIQNKDKFVVAQSPAKRLKQQGQIKNFFKPFSCTRCDYKSSTSASLKQHESIHTEKKTFSCTRCDYKSTTSNRLKEHEAIHNPTTSFRGWTDSETAVAALNASVTSASLNASLLNQGFREEDNTDQTYSQEDLEYENTLRALEQEISK